MVRTHGAGRTVSRDDAATALRRLADGVAAGSVSVDVATGPVAVDVPAGLMFEVELDQVEDEVELEAELEWEADGEAIRELDEGSGSGASGTDEAESDTDAAESTTDAAEPTADPAEQTVDSVVSTPGRSGSAADLVGPATDSVGPAVDGGSSQATFELFRDAADEWRWRLRHRNGNVVADSGEGYDRKAGALNGLESVKSSAPGAVVEEQTDE